MYIANRFKIEQQRFDCSVFETNECPRQCLDCEYSAIDPDWKIWIPEKED